MTAHQKESRLFGFIFLILMAVGSLIMSMRLCITAREQYRLHDEKNLLCAAVCATSSTMQKFHHYEYELKDVVVPKINFIHTAVHHLYTGYLLATGRRIIPADMPAKIVVRGPDDFLYYLNGFSSDPDYECVLFTAMHDMAKSRCVPMLQVVIPTKQLNYKTHVGNFIDLACDLNYAAFLRDTASLGVPRIDCAAIFQQLRVPSEHFFYRTDHHWTPFGAIHAVHSVVAWARQAYIPDWYPPVFSIDDDFTWTESPTRDMLGIQGLRLGRYWSVLDRSRLGTPRFKSNYRVEFFQPDGSIIEEKGDFPSTVSHEHVGSGKGQFFHNADYPKVTLVNESIPAGTILVIQDSFGRSFTSYLSLFAHRVIALDPRYYHVDGILSAAAAEDFDVIIYLRSEMTLGMIGTQVQCMRPSRASHKPGDAD